MDLDWKELEHMTVGVTSAGSGVGKDTVADFIAEALRAKGRKVRRAAFATPLRECVEALTGVTVAESQTAEGKARHIPELQMSVGRLLQVLGTDAVRNNVHKDAWCHALFRRFAADEIAVISDVRFPEEAAAVTNRKGLIVEVKGPRRRGLGGRDPKHESEKGLGWAGREMGRVVLHNSGTLEELRAKVETELVDVMWPTPGE